MPLKPSRGKKYPASQRSAEARHLLKERAKGAWRVQEIITPDGKRLVSPKYGYSFMSASLSRIEKNLGLDLKKMISQSEDKFSIIDLGCGEGTALQQLRKLFPDKNKVELVGVALNHSPMWKDQTIRWIVAPYYKLPKKLAGKNFDIAYSHFGIEYSRDITRDLLAVREILKDNGLLVITLPAFEPHPEYEHEYVEISLDNYLSKIVGFKLEKAFKSFCGLGKLNTLGYYT
ncbi:MAG: methyltransferase domain-containing protein [Candidatus Diapherotrites archaeon]